MIEEECQGPVKALRTNPLEDWHVHLEQINQRSLRKAIKVETVRGVRIEELTRILTAKRASRGRLHDYNF